MSFNREKLIKEMEIVLSIRDVLDYEKKLQAENPHGNIEKLVEFNGASQKIRVEFFLSSNNKLNKSLVMNFNYSGHKEGLENERSSNYFVLGDIKNPGLVNELLSVDILDKLNYQDIIYNIKTLYKHLKGKNASIIIYYCPKYNLVGFNVFKGGTVDILYYSLDEEDFVEFQEEDNWIKVLIEYF